MNALDGVIIGRGALDRAGQIVKEVAPTSRAFLCADTIVMDFLGDRVTHAFTASGLQVRAHTFPPGEESKSLHVAADLYDWLAAERAERREPLIALGGGVAGDLIGFVAATYARGIPLVQIPTTLLAQIDSSIGGKVAVDLPAGKNLVGAFYPAQRVIIDPDALATLPPRQLIADYAEAIKTAVIFDADLFDLIEASTDRLDDPALLAELVERCVRWKAKVVDEDPEDRGIRAILNYGHTIAHAIEATAGYGVYLHGEAVAIGMVGAGRLAEKNRPLVRNRPHPTKQPPHRRRPPRYVRRRRTHPGPRRHAQRQKSPKRHHPLGPPHHPRPRRRRRRDRPRAGGRGGARPGQSQPIGRRPEPQP